MATLSDRITLEEALGEEGEESTDPEYLAWKKAKIEATIRHMEENPDARVSLDEVMRKLGITG